MSSADPLTPQQLMLRAAALLASHGLETGLLLVSWVCIGFGALNGRLDPGWLAAWSMALFSTVPVHATSMWLQGVVCVGCGGLLKDRLLTAALAIEPEHFHRNGVGELLSKALETEAIDDLGANGGITSLLALVELLIAPLLFLWGAAGMVEIVVLLTWSLVSFVLIDRNVRLRIQWTRQRLAITGRLVENMGAHQTRLAQQPEDHRHRQEDGDLAEYLRMSCALDRGAAAIEAGVPRGYVLVASAALTPAFIDGSASISQLAVSFGTILFVYASLQRVCFGFAHSAAAWISWHVVSALPRVHHNLPVAMQESAKPAPTRESTSTLVSEALQIAGLGFSGANRNSPLWSGARALMQAGDKILLNGNSGCGKSMFASILAGARPPSQGCVLLGGLDRQSLGAWTWRRRVVLAPQAHENHIFSAPLSFNLLLARAQPYSKADIDEAVALCKELGLGDLLERMPAGLEQRVGDTGWTLSQGERSRVSLARALLQNADVIVLDETLAALDPQQLRQSLECILRRTTTVLLIANP